MNPIFRIALAEVLICSMSCTQFLAPIITYADETLSGTVDTQPIVVTDPVLTVIETTATGDMLTLEIQTGAVIESSESSIQDHTGTLTLPIFDTPVDLQEVREVQGQQIEITPVRSSTASLALPSDDIIVEFKSSSIDVDTIQGEIEIASIEQLQDITVTTTLPEENIVVMNVLSIPSNEGVSFLPSVEYVDTLSHEQKIDATIAALKTDPRVEHVQRNFKYQIQGMSKTLETLRTQKSEGYSPSTFTGRSQPNDARFSNLWGLDNQGQEINGMTGTVDADIDYPEAMSYASGRLSNTGVIVAVLDTGIAYTHPEFAGQLWDGRDCVSDTGAYIGNCIHGYNYANDSRDPMDDYFIYHGTHVAGTIGALGNNGTGVVGVAPRVRLMAVKIFDQYGGTDTVSIIRGIKFATNNGAQVINASFGGVFSVSRKSDFDFLTYNAIQGFPGLFVAAAGNNGDDSDSSGYKFFPAGFGSDTNVSGEMIIDQELVMSGSEIIPALDNVIAVAATDQYDELTYFSNYGTGSVHIAAPGANILSTVRTVTVSSEISTVSYTDGWQKQSTGKPTNWATRNVSVVSGEIDGVTPTFSGVLWGNTSSPYVSGENVYIQKAFPTQTRDIQNLELGIWCDTPASDYYEKKDYLEFLISTGGLYTSILDLDEERIGWYSGLDPLYIDGHTGAYVKMDFGLADFGVGNGPLSIRVRWHSDGIDDTENGQSYYGCFIDTPMTLTTGEYADGYEYLDGTSMASPHVAGAAALAMSFRPDTSLWNIRNSILYTGEYLSSLDGKLMIPNRLNILSMLQSLEIPKIIKYSHTISGESGIRIALEKSKESLSTYLSVANNKEIMSPNPDADYADRLAQSDIIPRVEKENEYHLYDTPLRGEVAKFLGKIGGYSGSGCTGTIFLDVTGALSDQCGYIENLARRGIFSTGSLYFNPDSSIDRAEGVRIILKTLGYTGSTIPAGYTDTSSVDSNTLLYINQIHALGCDYYNSTKFYPTAGVSRGELYKITACVTSLAPAYTTQRNTYFNGTRESQNGVNELWSVSGLNSDTTYYYHIDVCTQIVCDQTGVTMMFRTPKLVPSILTGSLTSTGNVYLGNSTTTGAVFSGGTASGKIILTNSGTNARVEIPTHNLRISASGSWDGVLLIPRMHTGSNIINSTEGILTASRIELIGNDTTSLILSGQLATIILPVTAQSGSTVRVYRAQSIGQIFSYIATCTITNNLCTFTTSQFSAFALGAPVPPPVISSGGGSSGGNGSISGPGGATSTLYESFSTKYLYPTPKSSMSSTETKTGTTKNPLPKKIVLSFFSRTQTVDLIEKSIITDGISKTVGNIRTEIEKNPSRIGRILSYDIIINFIGSRIREKGGENNLSGVQKKLSQYRSELISGKK